MSRTRVQREEEVRRKRARRYAGHANLSTIFTAQDFAAAARSPMASAPSCSAPPAARRAPDTDADLRRSAAMARDVLARSGDKVQMQDPASGLDVVYDLAGGAPDVDLKQVQQKLGPGRPLDGDTKDYMEWRFGVSLDKVRLHTGPKADAISKAIFAKAFALGEHVAFQSNTYRPGTAEGDRLLAHELMHVVQAGLAPDADTALDAQKGDKRTARKSATVSESTDSFEVEADRVADQVVAVGRGEFARARRDAAAGIESSVAPVVGRVARKVDRSATPAPQQEQAEAEGEEIRLTLSVGGGEIVISAEEAQESTYSTQVQGLTDFTDAPWLNLQLAENKVTGGSLKGWPAANELQGSPEWQVDAQGQVTGAPEVQWHCQYLGRGTMALSLADGALSGEAQLTKAEITGGGDLEVVSFSGSLTFAGGEVTAQGSGVGKLGNGALEGPLQLQYRGGATTGSVDGEIKSEGFLAAYRNGQSGLEPPTFRVGFEGGKWEGQQQVQYPTSAKGVDGQSSLDMQYRGGQLSGGGDGTFAIADFISGSVSNTVGPDGSVDGTFSLETNTFAIGPLTCESIRLSGGVQDGELDLKASGALSVAGARARGTFQSNLAQSQGLVWNGDVTFQIPKMKDTKVVVSYTHGQGFQGSGRIQPEAQELTGGVDLKFTNNSFTADGKFGIELPLLKRAELALVYANGNLTGSTTIAPGAFDLGRGLAVTNSSVTAHWGETGLQMDGTAAVKVGSTATGTLRMAYNGDKVDASVDSRLTLPGIKPVDLQLALKGESFEGKASTTVDVPFLKETAFEVAYKEEKFSGTARTQLQVPFLKGGAAELNLLPSGKLGGAVTVNPRDVRIPGVQLRNLGVTGRVADGKLSLQGQGTATGILGVKEATVSMKVDDGRSFSGYVEGAFDIPGLKNTKGRIDLNEDGTLSGKASVAADFAGAAGAINLEYKARRWSGGGTLSYSKGKFSGSIAADVKRSGKLSGKGRVDYRVSDGFIVGADVELREDGSMEIGGRITAPSEVPLFDTRWERNIFTYRGRFGVPGLSVQVPVVGVIGLEAQLGGTLKAFASARISLRDITATGSFDTATDAVDLDLRGTLAGTAEAGLTASVRLAVGMGVGPAFIGGYADIAGTAKGQTTVSAAAAASYHSSSGQLNAGIQFDASAGLNFELALSGGITGSVDLWLKKWEKDWPIASKTVSYNPGVTFEYAPNFDYTFGRDPSRDHIAPARTPRIDGNSIWRNAAEQIDL